MRDHGWTHALEYWALKYRRNWYGTFVSGIISPILFLAAIGAGLGALIDAHIGDPARIGGLTYLSYVAPGLLAFAAMQTAVGESTWPVTGAAAWRHSYAAMLATPLRVGHVFAGHLIWIALRVAMVSAAFLAAAVAFGTAHSWLAPLALPAATLTGVACAAPTMAFAVRQVNTVWFDVVFRFVVMPLFLFSGTFFPISRLPAAIRPVAYLTPLWHGADLCRALTTGVVRPAMVGFHLLYLLVLAAAGAVFAARSFRIRLAR